MCGRITQRSGELPGLVTVEGYGTAGSRTRVIGCASTERPAWISGLPGKYFKNGENQRDRMTSGLIPYWSKDGTGECKPINVKADSRVTANILRSLQVPPLHCAGGQLLL